MVSVDNKEDCRLRGDASDETCVSLQRQISLQQFHLQSCLNKKRFYDPMSLAWNILQGTALVENLSMSNK